MSSKQVEAIKRTESGAIDIAYHRACARDLRSQVFVRAARLMGNVLLRFIHAAVVRPVRWRERNGIMESMETR